MSKFITGFKRLLKEEDAPTMAEYGLLLVFLALAAAAGALTLGQGVSTVFTGVWDTILSRMPGS